MSVKSHATLLIVVSLIWFGSAALGAAVLWFGGREGSAVGAMFAGVISMPVVWEALLLLIPIQCDQPGCHGNVTHKWVTEERFRCRARYHCCDCGHETDAPISFGLGEGGDTWT